MVNFLVISSAPRQLIIIVFRFDLRVDSKKKKKNLRLLYKLIYKWLNQYKLIIFIKKYRFIFFTLIQLNLK
jgi:hypothetical protein